MIPRIAKAASGVTGTPYNELMNSWGVYFLGFVGKYGYDRILKVKEKKHSNCHFSFALCWFVTFCFIFSEQHLFIWSNEILFATPFWPVGLHRCLNHRQFQNKCAPYCENQEKICICHFLYDFASQECCQWIQRHLNGSSAL